MKRCSPPLPYAVRLSLLASLLTAGCSSPSFDAAEDDADPDPIERTDFCEKTRCELERDECWQDIETCENGCLSGSIDTFESCYAICRGIECPVCGADDECAVFGYRFELLSSPNLDIEAACERAVARYQRCSEPIEDPHCSHAARITVTQVVAAYECIAESACGTNVDSCQDALPPSDFGQKFCAALSACSDSQCDAEQIASLDELGRWLRPELTAAALECLDEGCENMVACLTAWSNAVSAPE